MGSLMIAHVKPATKTDEILAKEAASHHNGRPTLRVASAHLKNLCDGSFVWWTPKLFLERFPMKERMEALADRPDIRQLITTMLSGVKPRTARRMTPQFQADLIIQSL